MEDVKTLVTDFVLQQQSDAPTNEADPGHSWMKVRLDDLRVWKKDLTPLGWNGQDPVSYHRISRIVASTREDVRHGLPRSHVRSCSPRAFVDRFYKGATAESTRGVNSPLWTRGSAWAVARLCVAQCMLRLPETLSDDDHTKEIKDALEDCLMRAKINFFPDTLDGLRGEPDPRGWTLLGLPDSARSNLAGSRPMNTEERIEHDLGLASQAAMQSDVNAPWQTCEIDILEYHAYMDRTTIPADFDFGQAEVDKCDTFTQNLYKWANTQIRRHPGEWRARLAIHLAFLISKITPFVFWPAGPNDDTSRRLDRCSTMDEATSIFRALSWVKRTAIKGLSPSLYFSQALIFFFVWIHDESPLRQLYQQGKPNASEIAQQWTQKHR